MMSREIALMENSVQSWRRHFDLLDQLVRASEHVRWKRHADLFRGLEIDDELKLCRLLDGQVSRFCAFQDLVNEIGDAPVAVRDVRPVIHEPAGIYRLSYGVHRR